MSERPDCNHSATPCRALAIAACSVALLSSCGADPAENIRTSGSEPVSVVADGEPRDQSQQLRQLHQPEPVELRDRTAFRSEVTFRLGEFYNLIRIDLPELLSSRERAIAFAPVMGLPEEAHFGPRRYSANGLNSRIDASWDLVGNMVAMQISVTNTSEHVATDVTAAICVQSAFAPSFAAGLQKASFFSDGRPVSFAELQRSEGYRSAGALILGDASSDLAPGPGSDFLGSYSRHRSDNGVIFRTSSDGAATLATLWENAYRVYHNPMKHLDCIHSDPFFGDIEAGATVVRRGWMLVHDGPPEQARKRLLELREGH